MIGPYLRHVHDNSLEAKRRATDFTRLRNAPLKLGVMCTIAATRLLDLMCRMRSRHPGIGLSITDARPDELRERLLAGELEVAISCAPDREPETDERLHCHPLYREQFVIVVHPDHRLAGHSAIAVRDLQGEHYLERIHCEVGSVATRVFDHQSVVDETVYRSERDDWILAMAAAGLGYAFMPEHCARHPGVVTRPLVDPEIWRTVHLLTVRGRPYSPAVGALVREATRAGWSAKGPGEAPMSAVPGPLELASL
jgi:DNA-binding transcriptional LysR family regulator